MKYAIIKSELYSELMAVKRKYAIEGIKKRLGGRPSKWKDSNHFKQTIQEYFNKTSERDAPYTVSGLAAYLGYDRSDLIAIINGDLLVNFEESERLEFSHALKSARLFIESTYEENALSQKSNPVFTMFTLKNNFGWRDVKDQRVTHEGSITHEMSTGDAKRALKAIEEAEIIDID